MGRDRLGELREEWYSDSEAQPDTVEGEVDDELLALDILFRSRGVTVAGSESVTVRGDEEESETDGGD